MKRDRDIAEPLPDFLARIRAMSSAGYKRVAAGESKIARHRPRRKGVQRKAKTASRSGRSS